MKVSKKEVQKMAGLARLGIEEKEMKFYANELSAVLDYIDQLNEVDTDEVEVTNQVTGLHSATREDEPSIRSGAQQGDSVNALMKLVPFLEKGLVRVRAILKTN